MENKTIKASRDPYIDFLRAFGLLLLVVAHTSAPSVIAAIRTFDVPLMVFVSALCYKPLRGGYLTYARKRFVRLYKPVFIFLTLFFLAETASLILIGKPMLNYMQIAGSYLLLNNPSIGYVWIMRVFIIMALAIPFLYILSQRINWTELCMIVLSLILIQPLIIWSIGWIEWKILRFALSETLPYLIGYSAIVLPAFKIKSLSRKQIFITLGLLLCSIILMFAINGIVSPQRFKYPPQSLYILYGLFCSIALWSLRPVIGNLPLVSSSAVTYLSSNSMWIYLWHIIPVYALSPLMDVPGLWFGRFMTVTIVAILLNMLWHRFLKLLPDRIAKTLG
ncbi:MAG: acyltransferase [Duncaniella sp.]|nr:acyltransferase [Duncaniella sp.]